ncbi:MAG: peptidoglycan-binding protein, partial [Oscillospiraceae bacterium]|nr:peptidoglycan-binding protein [Oscillospiraceae bacterium]
ETQLDPELPVKPYDRYIIDITADGYLEDITRGVQIYGDSSSNLPVDIIPETPANTGSIVTHDIGENALLEVSTHQEAPLGITPAIESEVYIPTHIIVHLGTPASNARNVTVRFADYIKNVASSEIFPDWPYHSLRANIHAQISLTLNRVYTEWYRSQGYNFHITNSTQYDQYFVEGRNIFASVSGIVDEIFNSYVVRPPGTEPYFTEYCNGTTATCPGMKQWGTVTLAKQNMDYLQILRYYYGQSIYIATTNNIKTDYESFPGYLSTGASGPNVSVIQRQLNRIRQNYPAIPVIAATDGVYGTQTAAAVKKFQEIFGLPQTGAVDRATWYKISYVYVAVKKLAELGSEGEPSFPSILLKLGSVGDDVALMQRYLNALGQRYTVIPQQTVDGIFGNNMQRAVIAFQQLFGLTADGIIGRITWDRIVAEYNKLPTSPPSTVNPPFPGYNISQGQTGNNVLTMQRYLNTIGRFYPDIPRLTEDGIFGPMTRNAVVTFQRLYNLTADGIIGRNTWDKIVTVYDGLPAANNPPFPGILLSQGMQNEHIRTMQTFLNAIGRKYTQIPQVEAVGIFGPLTHQAVLTFQRLFGLVPDGVIGRITWNKIVEEYNKL